MFFKQSQTPEHIGLKETLAGVHLETEYGRLALKALTPLNAGKALQLQEAWDEIGAFLKAQENHPGLMKEMKHLLQGMKNIRRFLSAAAAGAVLTEVELFEIKKQAFGMDRLRKYMHQHRGVLLPAVTLQDVQWLMDLLDPEETRIETFYLYDAYDEALKKVRQCKLRLEETMVRLQKRREREMTAATGLVPLWNGDVLMDKTRGDQKKNMEALGTYHVSGETNQEWIYRQGGEEGQDQWEALLLKESILEEKVRCRLSAHIGNEADALTHNTFAVGQLDLIIGKTMLSRGYGGSKPVIRQGPGIDIRQGRHPVLEKGLRRNARRITPVDISLKQGATVITGANMGGKTMVLKMVALLSSLAQMGFWVPAEHMAFRPVNWLYFSSGDDQSQSLGLSTFGAEIHGLKHILDHTHEEGLILLDELASGTNPSEGACISRAIVTYLREGACVSLVTTHYDGVGDLPQVKHLQVMGLKRDMLISLKTVIEEKGWQQGVLDEAMDYRLQPKESGTPVPRDAIAVAELMGFKPEILREARRILEMESVEPREAE